MRTVAGFSLLAVLISLWSCSSSDQAKKAASPVMQTTTANSANSSNPVAKYVEIAGFRLSEKSPGHLQIRFAVINHSEADIGDIAMNVILRTTTAKPSDPPLFTFPVKVDGLGPGSLKEVTADLPTKLRIYELPDWQFLRADFQITSPQ
ncbi:MAG: hypothetical protein ACRD4E_03690 [Bryobacteraceae bacterium]